MKIKMAKMMKIKIKMKMTKIMKIKMKMKMAKMMRIMSWLKGLKDGLKSRNERKTEEVKKKLVQQHLSRC